MIAHKAERLIVAIQPEKGIIMAKSIFQVMSDRTFETRNGNEELNLDLPSWFPSDFLSDTLEALPVNAQLALIANGCQKALIDLRAVVRAEMEKENGDVKKAVKEFLPTIPEKPATAKTKGEKLQDLFAGMKPEEIAAALVAAGIKE